MSTKVGIVEPQHLAECGRFEIWASRKGVEAHVDTGRFGDEFDEDSKGIDLRLDPVRARALAALLIQAAAESDGMRCRPSDGILSDPLSTAENERQMAKNWADSAAQHCRNEEYYRKRAEDAEAELAALKLGGGLRGEALR